MRRETLALPVVFRRRDAVRDGVITERELRGPGYQRVLHGVYTVRGIPLTHEIRCQAAALLLAPGSVVTGGSAATMLGVELNQWSDDVEVLIPEGGRWTTPRGLSTRRARRVLHGETVSGVPLATRDRMAFDLASRGDLAEAVARLDVVVRSGLLHLDRYRRWLGDLHDPHVVLARRAAELCDPRAESRPESIVRVVLHLADLVAEPGFYVYDRSGRFVARLDWLWRSSRWRSSTTASGTR